MHWRIFYWFSKLEKPRVKLAFEMPSAPMAFSQFPVLFFCPSLFLSSASLCFVCFCHMCGKVQGLSDRYFQTYISLAYFPRVKSISFFQWTFISPRDQLWFHFGLLYNFGSATVDSGSRTFTCPCPWQDLGIRIDNPTRTRGVRGVVPSRREQRMWRTLSRRGPRSQHCSPFPAQPPLS